MHPEYHELFKNNQKAIDKDGYTLTITGLTKGVSLPEKHIRADDISKLIDPVTGMFVSQMRFDDWLFNIMKIKIDVFNRMVMIVVSE